MNKSIYGVGLLLAWPAFFAHDEASADSIQEPHTITSPCPNIGLDDVFAVGFSTGELIKFQATDPSGTKTTLLTAGSLVSPTALIVGPDCDLYIGESGDGSTYAPRVSKFELDTLTLSTVYPFSAFDVFPGSFVFLGDDLLIGRDSRLNNTGPVVRLSGAISGALAVSDYTSGGLDASSPGLALDALGRLYVSDQDYGGGFFLSGSVKRFDASGQFVEVVVADSVEGLVGPAGLVVWDNTLFTGSLQTQEVLQTDLSTDTTQAFSSFGAGPLAVMVDGLLLSGTVDGNGSIYFLDTDGSRLGTFASGLGEIGGLTTIADFNLSIGGSVTGLASGQTLVLQNNARDDLTISANGSFTFDDPLPQGSDYSVSIKTQPVGQTCSLGNATGTALGSNVTNVQVSCMNNAGQAYRISSVTGDTISGTLVFSGSLASDGTFSFLSDGAPLSSPVMTVTWVDSRTYQVISSGTMAGTFVMPGYLPEGQQDFASDGSPLSSPFFSWNGGVAEGLPNQNDDFLVSNGLVNLVKYDVLSDANQPINLRLDGTYVIGNPQSPTELGFYYIMLDGETTDTSDFSTLPDQNDSYVISGGQLTAMQYDLLGSTFELKLQADGSFLVREGSTDVGGGTYTLSALYAIGGSVSGLASGASLVLKNNGGDDLTINANGHYVFSTLLASSKGFNVTVGTQPIEQTCIVSNPTGTVSGADVSNIAVTCTTNSYSVGGVLTGLADGLSVTLQNNGADDLTLTNDGAFSFTSPVLHNTGYAVSVSNQPSTQTCVVSDGSGTVNGSAVSNVAVSCSDNNYSVGGLVSGLLPQTSLVLQNNGGDDLTVTANGAFTFDGLLLQGSAYAVTIKTQPVGQTCSLNNAIGASINANLTNIEVVCSVNSYALGGVVNGLATGLSVTLQNNGGDDLTLSSNGNFIFASLVPYRSSYSVSVGSQPSTQTCVVSDGSGTVGAAAIADVVVACTDNTFSVGGEISGLLPGRSLVLQNNAGDDLTVSGNGVFAFNTGLTSGSGYVVSVKTQPAGQVCSVGAGSGSVAGADVVEITIACTVIPTIFRDQFQGST